MDGDGHDAAEAGGDDCDDTDAAIHPDAGEIACDGIDNDCDGAQHPNDLDDDGDGFSECYGDCDDTAAAAHPGAPDVCDAVTDNDCDGAADPLETDDDGDGASECDGDCDDADASLNRDDDDADGWTTCDGDCDDAEPTAFVGAVEACDGIDNDCDTLVDDDDPDVVDRRSWYADADADGYGDADDVAQACDQPPGYVADDTDCDDTDAAVHPTAPEAA